MKTRPSRQKMERAGKETLAAAALGIATALVDEARHCATRGGAAEIALLVERSESKRNSGCAKQKQT